MEFNAPEYFWLLLLAIPIILLYFLKLKRKSKYVTSTLLWEKTLEDLRVNSPFQKLKHSLLLILQLLILLLFTTALAEPVNETSFSVEKRVIFLLDNSASMRTFESVEGKTRLAIAKQKIERAISGIKSDELIALITFASRAEFVQNFTSEKSKFYKALDAVKISETSTNLEDALILVSALQKNNAKVEIIILSDGNFNKNKISKNFTNLNLRYVPIGQDTENVGLLNVAARINPQLSTQYDISATIKNFGNSQATGILEFRLNGAIIDAKQFSLDGGQEEFYTISDSRIQQGVLEVEIMRNDSLLVDNKSSLILPEPAEIRILLVTDDNPFLENFLSVISTEQGKKIIAHTVNVKTGLKICEESAEDYDIVFFDLCSPDILSAGNYVFLSSVPKLKNWGLDIGKLVKSPEAKPPAKHPLTKFIDMHNVFINSAPILKVPTSSKVLLECEETPLIALYTQKGLKLLVLGFDVFDSTWPLQLSFPIFFKNIVSFMAGNNEVTPSFIHSTGESLSIFSDGEKEATLLTPKGDKRDASAGSDGYWHFGELDEAGIWTLIVGSELSKISSALFDEKESSIVPQQELFFEGENTEIRKEELKNTTAYWQYFLIAGLLLLVFEWYVYHRRPFG